MKTLNLCVLLTLCFGVIVFTSCNADADVENSQTANNLNKTASNNENAKNEKPEVNQSSETAAESETQKSSSFAGNWDSEKLNEKGNKRTEVSLFIKQTGDKISGTYSVVDFVGNEPQIEDGNQTPFIGTVKGNTATVKFDPDATVPGYEESVEYKEPADGKAPATAVLTLSGQDLQVNITSGEFGANVPKKITFQKAKPIEN